MKVSDKTIKEWNKILNTPHKIPAELVAKSIYPAFYHKENPKEELAQWMDKHSDMIATPQIKGV